MLRRIPPAFALIAGCLFVVLPARAQVPPLPSPAPSPAAEVALRVAAISPWMDPDRPLRVSVRILNSTDVAIEDAVVRVAFYSPVRTRSELRLALDRGRSSGLLGTASKRLEAVVAPGEQRAIAIQKDAREISTTLARTGVYPVRITLQHSAGSVSAWTAIPFFSSPPSSRLNLSWILPVTAPTAERPDGVYEAASLDALGTKNLAQQMEVLAARPGLAVTLAPSPSLLDTAANLANGFAVSDLGGISTVPATNATAQDAAAFIAAARRAATSVAEIATVPYAPADLPSLARRGLREDLVRQFVFGRTVIESRLGRTASNETLVPPAFTLDDTSGAALAPLGAQTVVLDTGSIPPSADAPFQPNLFGPSTPVPVRARATTYTALLPDNALRARLDGEGTGALLAQALIAETASAWLEMPVFAGDRLLVLASRRLADPVALAAAADGFRTAPWLRLRTASDAARALAPEGTAVALPSLVRPDSAHLRAARTARRAMALLNEIAAGTVPGADRLDRLIMLSESDEWDATPGMGRALARAVSESVAEVVDRVRVVSDRRVTLTSKTGAVPVTLLNGNDFPVRVRVGLRSAKVGFPAGAERIVELQDADETVDFEVESLGTGSFPVDVTVQSPRGTRVLARGQIVIRSTVVSSVALAAVGGSALFLLIAWIGRGLHRRRNGRSVAASPGTH